MPTPSPALKRLPRWRTMISPPVTVWPANTFTPRRLAFESRPLREEPRPFLCAIYSVASSVVSVFCAPPLLPPGPTMSVTSMRVRFWRWPVRLR